MDFGASTSFTTESPDTDVMSKPPRKGTLFDRKFVWVVISRGILMFLICLMVYVVSIYEFGSYSSDLVQTCVFVGWLFAHVLLANSMRSLVQPLVPLKCGPRSKGCCSNSIICLWTISALLFALIVVSIPGFASILGLTSFSDPRLAVGFLWVFIASFLILLFHELTKYLNFFCSRGSTVQQEMLLTPQPMEL